MDHDQTKANKTSWFVYIIETHSGKLYTGITTNLERRFKDHQERTKGARFFRISDPKKIVYTESCENRSLATKREIAIKKLNLTEKLKLIKKCLA